MRLVVRDICFFQVIGRLPHKLTVPKFLGKFKICHEIERLSIDSLPELSFDLIQAKFKAIVEVGKIQQQRFFEVGEGR